MMSAAAAYRDPGTTGAGLCRNLRDPIFTGSMVPPHHPLYKVLTIPGQMPTTVTIF